MAVPAFDILMRSSSFNTSGKKVSGYNVVIASTVNKVVESLKRSGRCESECRPREVICWRGTCRVVKGT